MLPERDCQVMVCTVVAKSPVGSRELPNQNVCALNVAGSTLPSLKFTSTTTSTSWALWTFTVFTFIVQAKNLQEKTIGTFFPSGGCILLQLLLCHSKSIGVVSLSGHGLCMYLWDQRLHHFSARKKGAMSPHENFSDFSMLVCRTLHQHFFCHSTNKNVLSLYSLSCSAM